MWTILNHQGIQFISHSIARCFVGMNKTQWFILILAVKYLLILKNSSTYFQGLQVGLGHHTICFQLSVSETAGHSQPTIHLQQL